MITISTILAMSQEEVLSGKAKKAKRSEERFKKGQKRKRAEEPAAVPEDREEEEEHIQDATDATEVSGQNVAQPKKRLRAKQQSSSDPKEAEMVTVEASGPSDAKPAKKKRKRTKQDPSSTDAPLDAANTEVVPTSTTEQTEPTEGDNAQDESGATKPSKQRFIVFIGNLPFTTTTEMVTTHFASITPTSVRHLTDPKTNKSKGYAFLEFSNYDRMKTCLKLYHHSVFDTGKGGEKGKRRINVELTAGGGGKSGNRKEKLKVKNERLEGERKRRAEAAAKEAAKEGAKGDGKGSKAKGDQTKGARSGRGIAVGGEDAAEGIHPARLARMGR